MVQASQPATDSSTHTPLLWQRNGQTMNGWWRIDGSSERVGVDFMEHPAAIVPDEADADLIVRAVNNHPQLLKALKEWHSHIERWHSEDAAGEGRRCTACIEYECMAHAAIEEAQS